MRCRQAGRQELASAWCRAFAKGKAPEWGTWEVKVRKVAWGPDSQRPQTPIPHWSRPPVGPPGSIKS